MRIVRLWVVGRSINLIQPTVRQAAGFEALLEAQRELYNAALEERRGAWQWERRTVTRYQQYRTLTGLRAVRPDVLHLGRHGLPRDPDRASTRHFQAFYRRCAQGQRPGFPRFRGEGRWESVQWPDVRGWRFDPNSRRLYTSGHWPRQGADPSPAAGVYPRPAPCVVRDGGGGSRFSAPTCPTHALPPTGRQVGVDRGVSAVAATSDGTVIDNPRFLAHATGRLAAAQRAVAATPGRPKKRSPRST